MFILAGTLFQFELLLISHHFTAIFPHMLSAFTVSTPRRDGFRTRVRNWVRLNLLGHKSRCLSGALGSHSDLSLGLPTHHGISLIKIMNRYTSQHAITHLVKIVIEISKKYVDMFFRSTLLQFSNIGWILKIIRTMIVQFHEERIHLCKISG